MLVSILLTFLLVAFAKAITPSPYSCTEDIVTITNSTDIDFYKTCPSLPFMFFIDHNFTGPFELPGLKSIGQFSAGYLGPKLKGSSWIDDGVTTVDMPDLQNLTIGSMLFGYIQNLSSIKLPKLEEVPKDLVFIGNPKLRTVDLPSLRNVSGGILLDGSFDSISLPSLKTVGYLIVKSIGKLDCVALGKNLSTLSFTPKKYDVGVGFTCWTPYASNTYNSSAPGATGTSTGTSTGAATATGSGSPATTETKASGAEALRVLHQWRSVMLLWSLGLGVFAGL